MLLTDATTMLAMPSGDQRRGLAVVLAISVLLHLLIALLFLAWPQPSVFIEPPSESTVQMLFATGPPDTTPSASPAPQAAPETTLPAAAAPASPVLQAAPETSLPTPTAPALSLPPRPAPSVAAESSPSRPPARHAPSVSRRTAFPAPMRFSFGGTPSPSASAPSRRSARRGVVDYSIGSFANVPVGAPPRAPDGLNMDIRVTGAQVGAGWIEQLQQFWITHRYYPDEAASRGEDGMVELHMIVDRSGQVTALDLVASSGSRWLDMAGQSVFRGAHLPPFPANTPEPTAEVELRLYYILIR